MNETELAIEHFSYGISHDIYSEPVTTYAKLAVEALKEKAEARAEAAIKLLQTIDWVGSGAKERIESAIGILCGVPRGGTIVER